MKHFRSLVTCATLLAVSSAAPCALASAGYLAPVMAKGWKGDCSLCHTAAAGGDAAVKPFALSLKALGLTGSGNTASLDAALAAATTVDSDGDTIPDLSELMGGSDPNVPGATMVESAEPIEYGCFNSIVGRASEHSWGAAFAGFLAVALLRSRRRAALR